MAARAHLNKDANYRYVRLADEMESKILGGGYKAGEKLPSLRKLHRRMGLSISTVYQAYIELEKRGAVEPREKSGFYVRPVIQSRLPSPKLKRLKAVPKRVTISGLAGSILEAMSDDTVLNLGGAVPAPELLPSKQLSRMAKSIPTRELETLLTRYDRPGGLRTLRRQIMKRTFGLARPISIEDVITTNGCLEAVGLCLRAVAKPGDTILVESPTFHGFLQLIEDLNMYALEVSTCPETGVDLAAVEKAVHQNRVAACLFIPNFQNPLGALMPDDAKRDMVGFLNNRDIPIIEDDIYGDLHFEKSRPSNLKTFDKKGLVLYCSSFSKALAPGMRVGWTIPGRFKDKVRQLKLDTTIATPKLNQHILAQFLMSGAYDRHLRKLRNALKNQVSNMALAVAEHFPEGTRITSPKGGLLLWVQLMRALDGLEIYHQAMKENISILPGVVCSVNKGYRNCLRLSCGHPWNARVEEGIIKLAEILDKLS